MSDPLTPPDLVPQVPDPRDLPRNLGIIVLWLRRFIGEHASRNRTAVPITDLLWVYLGRVERRFAALVERVRAGEAAIVAPARPRAAPAVPRTPRPRLSRGFGWLLRTVPLTGQFASQLRHLLSGAEFAALLAADPRAGAILRPLCRMLAIGPDPGLPPALFPPPERRKPPPSAPASSDPETDAAPSPEPERPDGTRPYRTRPDPAPRHHPVLLAAPA